jgi:biotin carboxylase
MKIACFDTLEVLLSPERWLFYYIVVESSPLRELIEYNVPKDRIVPVSLASEDWALNVSSSSTLCNSDFIEKAKQFEISHLFLSDRPTQDLRHLCASAGIEIVAPPDNLRDEFEDKNRFHTILERFNLPVPRGRIVSSISDCNSDLFPGVLQEPSSSGSLGTFFVNTKEDVAKVVEEKKLKWPLLLRHFEEGVAIGVTILLAEEQAVVSSLRVQCLLEREPTLKPFCGIQWIPTADLQPADLKAIEEMLIQLTRALQELNFYGIANIDFLLGPDGPLIIECNPRLSGATWFLSPKPELIHGANFVEGYMETVRGRRPLLSSLEIPKTTFCGATLDFDWKLIGVSERLVTREKALVAGLYKLVDGKACFHSFDLNDLELPQTFLFYPYARPGKRLETDKSCGILLSYGPLYDLEGGSPHLTAWGREVMEVFAREIL